MHVASGAVLIFMVSIDRLGPLPDATGCGIYAITLMASVRPDFLTTHDGGGIKYNSYYCFRQEYWRRQPVENMFSVVSVRAVVMVGYYRVIAMLLSWIQRLRGDGTSIMQRNCS